MNILKKLLGREKPKQKIQLTEIETDKKTADHIRRFNFPIPEGYPKKLFDDVKIVGISYRRDTAVKFINGYMIGLEARSEHDNPKDDKAIAIYAHWRDPEGEQVGHIGYLPAAIAAKLMTLDPLNFAMRVDTIFLPRPGKSPGFRISIWAKRGAVLQK